MWSQALSGMRPGLFDVGGKVGETPQNSSTPAVPQGGSAHCRCCVPTRLPTACTPVSTRYSRLQMLSGRWELLQKGSSQNPSCYCSLWLRSLPRHPRSHWGGTIPSGLWSVVSGRGQRRAEPDLVLTGWLFWLDFFCSSQVYHLCPLPLVSEYEWF